MTALGKMYQDGRGVLRDYAKAREWYEKAGDAKPLGSDRRQAANPPWPLFDLKSRRSEYWLSDRRTFFGMSIKPAVEAVRTAIVQNAF
jgi:hypothetical protein